MPAITPPLLTIFRLLVQNAQCLCNCHHCTRECVLHQSHAQSVDCLPAQAAAHKAQARYASHAVWVAATPTNAGNDALVEAEAYEELAAYEADKAYEALVACSAYEAVTEYEADKAYEALVAWKA